MPTIFTFSSAVRLAAAVAAVLVASWASAQSLTLTVPHRGASSMQTASTTIEFDASAIAGGATISISRTAPLPSSAVASVVVPGLGCLGLACQATPASPIADDILVTRIGGTNRAQLQLTYFESFGANFCSYNTALFGTSAKTYDVTLSGFTFGASNGYRMTSFMAPGIPGLTEESCDIPYARVPGPRPILAGSVPKLGRLPLNVVLALDKSPSMAWDIPAAPGVVRWDALKAAAQLFTNVWDVIGAPPMPATISSEGHAEDRLGLIFFGGTAIESPLDGASFFKSRGAAVTPWGGPVAAALAPAPPVFISGTSIGAGTLSGRSRLDTVDLVQGDTAILLFTDGEQNTPPCIIHQGETLSPTTKPYPGLPGQTYVDQCTIDPATANPGGPLTLNAVKLAKDVLPRGPIFTIGLGEGGTVESAALLDAIAQQTAGQSHYPLTTTTLTMAFIDTLVDNLKGGTVSTLQREVGTVPAAATASAPMTVAIDPSLTRAVFVLGWDGVAREVLLEIRRPDGKVVTSSLRENTANSRVAAVNLPADGPSGAWQARLVRQSGTANPLNYHLTAYGVESRLSSRVTQSSQLGTGRSVKIVAEVGWDDNGLADLPSGAIVATIERPSENLGNLLRARLTGDPAPAQKDASPLMVKFHRLAETPGFLARIQPRALAAKVPLASVGNGRYEGTFDGANIGGHYRIRVDYDWNDPRSGAIRRQHIAERQVPVVPSAADSVVQVQREPRSKTAQVVVTLRDRFGNDVGPGHESRFNVRVEGAAVAPVSDPDVTGSYAIRLTGLAADADPRVKISFGDQTIRDARVSKLESGGGVIDTLPWWAWLLLILLIVLLLALIWNLLKT